MYVVYGINHTYEYYVEKKFTTNEIEFLILKIKKYDDLLHNL